MVVRLLLTPIRFNRPPWSHEGYHLHLTKCMQPALLTDRFQQIVWSTIVLDSTLCILWQSFKVGFRRVFHLLWPTRLTAMIQLINLQISNLALTTCSLGTLKVEILENLNIIKFFKGKKTNYLNRIAKYG
jgi:hypothetical protein